MLEHNTTKPNQTHKPQTPRAKRLGLTMVETLLVLLVVSIAIIGALTAFKAAQKNIALNTLRNDITRAVAIIQRSAQFSGSLGAAGDDLVSLLDGSGIESLGSVASTVIDPGTLAQTTTTTDAFLTPSKNEIEFTATTTGFTVTIPEDDADECIAAAEPFLSSTSGVTSIQTGTTDVPRTAAGISAACNGDDDIVITF